MIGEIVGRYRVVERLGEGGMGVVFRAEDTHLGRAVALKFLGPELVNDTPSVERFFREARLASGLSHPHVCTVHEIGEHQGAPFIAMELIDGRSLHDEIGGRPLPLDRILELGVQISDALDAAHDAGVVHRDIKAANIAITRRGLAKVLDFGLAKRLPTLLASRAGAPPSHGAATEAGTTVGTVTHMSPEQVEGREVDHRSDLFSLGVVLYEMATGTLPFDGATPFAILQGIVGGTQAPASSRNPSITPELERIIARLLEKDRAARYQSAAEVRADLARVRRDLASSRSLDTVALPVTSVPAREPGGTGGGTGGQEAAAPRATAISSPAALGSIQVVEPWDAVARDGREFADRGSGVMYWFKVPLGGVSFPDGFRSFLRPALENPRITRLRFVLDASVPTIAEVWSELVVPQIQAWIKRTGSPLLLERGEGAGRFYDPESDVSRVAWVLTDLSAELTPCFKIYVDDPDAGLRGLGEAQVFIATATRSVRLADGTQRSVRIPDTILRARGAVDEKLLVALRRVAAQWDSLFP